jgi:tetratricopeptide (TPR) repeat protein
MAYLLLSSFGMKYFPVFFCFLFLLGQACLLSAAKLEEGMGSPHLKKAWVFLEAGRPQKALECLDREKTDPKDALYFYLIRGKSWEKMSQPNQALADYRSAYFHAPSPEKKALVLLERAEANLRLKYFDEAKWIYSLFFNQFSNSPDLPRAHLGIAQCLTALNALDEALPHYEQAGGTAAAFLGKALTLNRLGRFPEARDYFIKGITLNKALFEHNQEFILAFGENLLQLGYEQEAMTYLLSKRFDLIFKKKAELALGVMAFKTGNFPEAIKFFESAQTTSDQSTREQALSGLGETYLKSGKTAQARQAFGEYWSRYPGGKQYERALLILGKLDLEVGRAEAAGRWLKELGTRSHLQEKTLLEIEALLLHLKEKDPRLMGSLWSVLGPRFLQVSREPFLLLIAEGLKGSGKPYLLLQQWLAQNGSESVRMQSRAALVRHQIETGRLKEAGQALSSLKGTRLPKEEQLRLEAALLRARGEYRQASRILLSMKKIGPQDLSLLQESLLLGGDLEQALPAIEKNLTRLGGNGQIYSRLGDLYYAKGKKKEALHYYQKVLETDPLNEWALLRAGSLLKGEEAQKMLGKIRDEKSLVGKLAKSGLREMEIHKKMGDWL